MSEILQEGELRLEVQERIEDDDVGAKFQARVEGAEKWHGGRLIRTALVQAVASVAEDDIHEAMGVDWEPGHE